MISCRWVLPTGSLPLAAEQNPVVGNIMRPRETHDAIGILLGCPLSTHSAACNGTRQRWVICGIGVAQLGRATVGISNA